LTLRESTFAIAREAKQSIEPLAPIRLSPCGRGRIACSGAECDPGEGFLSRDHRKRKQTPHPHFPLAREMRLSHKGRGGRSRPQASRNKNRRVRKGATRRAHHQHSTRDGGHAFALTLRVSGGSSRRVSYSWSAADRRRASICSGAPPSRLRPPSCRHICRSNSQTCRHIAGVSPLLPAS
jgi:hypothetical protein